MQTFNIHTAKTQLSHLIEEAVAGHEIIIARAGKPVARLVPFQTRAPTKRSLGALSGRLRIPDDFDAPLPDTVLDSFEGR